MKGFIELAKADLNQAMNLMDYIPGGREAILKFARPGANQEHRKFFLNAAKTETDPEILHAIGIRDLPNRIRFAVMDNPNTLLKTIKKMANQTNNNAVQDRAKKRLPELKANPESPKSDMMESKFKMSTKDIKKIIREELQRLI